MGFLKKINKLVVKVKEAQERFESKKILSKQKEIESLKKKVIKKKTIDKLDSELEELKKQLE